MRALSVLQPWATLIILGAKRFETRDWQTVHRGPLAVHASRKFPARARELCEREPFRSALRRGGIRAASDMPRGVLLGTVELARCLRVEELADVPDDEYAFGNFFPGQWAWELRVPLSLPTPLPTRGRLGLFELALP